MQKDGGKKSLERLKERQVILERERDSDQLFQRESFQRENKRDKLFQIEKERKYSRERKFLERGKKSLKR